MRRVLASVVVAGLAGAWGAAPARADGRNLTGQPAPEIYVQHGLYGLQTGCTLQSFRGRPVVLKFFFTECPACRESLPEFERLFRQYGSRVQFIAVGYDSRWAIESMWRRAGYTVPIAVDENGLTAARYGVATYPTSYLVGADGVVRASDTVTSGQIERELARSGVSAASAPGPAASASPAIAAGGGVPTSMPTATTTATTDAASSAGDRNVAELGDVPAALAGVKDAARRNDYGAVLRVVERHFDPATDGADVLAAAHRIEQVAILRSERRKQRILERWKLGDQRGAYEQIGVMADDFKATQLERPLRDWADRVRADLVARGVLVASR